ncbi:uncharacterized protein [Miscanthus floridulus]|uniref:uncharacterized protein n=1 Tax=Miscanthus floridulus TaxID=154761 RepID=UPI00345810F2
MVRLHFTASNNMAKYEALINGLQVAIELGLVRCLEDTFDGPKLNHIARKYNEATDELAKMASARAPVPLNVFARDLYKPSIDHILVAEEGPPIEPTTGLDAPSATETLSTKPEVMEVNTEPPQTDQDTDWQIPFLDWLD